MPDLPVHPLVEVEVSEDEVLLVFSDGQELPVRGRHVVSLAAVLLDARGSDRSKLREAEPGGSSSRARLFPDRVPGGAA